MISRHIECEPQNDDYRRLANYIADAGHDGEKCLMSWCVGCWAGDDEYQLAIQEVVDTQALNLRTTKEKTYHLLISFRPEDEAKLTPEIFREIETEFANVLGYADNQRHCGVHRNTDNIHLHIAFNMIGKERHNRHEPHRDFIKRDRLCRELELRYGLTIDNGRDENKARAASSDVAKAYEAHTGQESFFTYAQRHKSDILSGIGHAADWADCHNVFHQFGLSLKLHGNGMIIQSHDGKHSIKASGLDRSISKSRLEKRFGYFQAPDTSMAKSATPASEYTAAPLQKDPDRDDLYQRYLAEITKRRTEMDDLGQQEKRLYTAISQKWDDRYKSIVKLPMTRQHRAEVMKDFKAKKQQDFAAHRRDMKEKREEVAKRYPYTNWSKFLRHEAGLGNESALDVLRSKKTKIQPDRPIQPTSNQSDLAKAKSTLAAVDTMRELFKLEGFKEPQYTIDAKGTIIFKLSEGGSIRDVGTEIHYSHGNDLAKRLAAKLAHSRWGQAVYMDNGVLKNTLITPPVRQQIQDRSGGMER